MRGSVIVGLLTMAVIGFISVWWYGLCFGIGWFSDDLWRMAKTWTD